MRFFRRACFFASLARSSKRTIPFKRSYRIFRVGIGVGIAIDVRLGECWGYLWGECWVGVWMDVGIGVLVSVGVDRPPHLHIISISEKGSYLLLGICYSRLHI